MALYKISDRYPNYQDTYFQGNEVKGMDVISAEDRKVGQVSDVLIDDDNRIQFLVVTLGSRKQVLMPANRCAQKFEQGRVYARSLNQQEIKSLPPYIEGGEVYNQPEYALEQSLSVEDSAPVEGRAFASASPVRSKTTFEEPAPAPAPSPSAEQPIQLYEERLVTSKQRIKTGEVKISKHTVTETTDNNIPITREKVIIEIESIYAGQTKVDFGDAEVAADGTVRMGIYEEQAEVCRRIVPYQNVSVRKEVVQDVVNTQQTVRREELDVQTQGDPDIAWVTPSE